MGSTMVFRAALISKKQILPDEVAAYKHAVRELDPEVKPLAFWFASRERFPQLFEHAIHCLSVPGNSVDAERSISQYTVVNAPAPQHNALQMTILHFMS